MWKRDHCCLDLGAQGIPSCSQEDSLKGHSMDDIGNSGHLFSGSLMALWPSQSRKVQGRGWGRGHPEPELRQVGCAGF